MDNHKLAINPDELKLSKDDLKEMIRGMIKRWEKNKMANKGVILSGYGMLTYIKLTKEEDLVKIFKEIVDGFNRLVYFNGLAHAKANGENWADAFEKLKDNVKKGDW